MIRSLLIVVWFSVAALQGADEKKTITAKVGDWVEYKCSSISKDDSGKEDLRILDRQYEMRYTVSEISNGLATLKCLIKGREKENEEFKYFIDLTSGEFVNIIRNEPEDNSTELVATGTEVLSYKGKDIKCDWTKSETKPFPRVTKVWKSSEIPLLQMIKREDVIRFEPTTTTILSELKDFGSGK